MKPAHCAPADPAAAVKFELASEVLRSFGNLRFQATGWSMLPSLFPGDTLVVERVNPEQVQVGEVVLVERDGGLCAHRVVRTPLGAGEPRWITQGDAMLVPDRPVCEHELLGSVVCLIRKGRFIAVPARLSAVERLAARIVRRSVPAARALVYLHRVRQSSEETVLPCQG